MSDVRTLRLAAGIPIFLCVAGGIAAAGEAATGLIPISEREWTHIRRTWGKVIRVRPNVLGLGRINAARAAKGLPAVTATGAAPFGGEVEAAIVEGDGPEPLAPEGSDQPLPAYVDNSTLDAFPPIRSQGSLNSCVSWATTYYQMTHNTALARGWNARAGGDQYRFSPKWTYNFVNGGGNNGTYVSDNYNVISRHGAARWSEFPCDSNCLEWDLNTDHWRNAVYCRTNAPQYVFNVSGTGLAQLKQLLNDGYVVTFATYVNSWQYKTISDDPSTSADDPFAGKDCCFWVNGTAGGHAMTFVGYNDDIWVDINSNGTVEAGEKGALRVANSWGTGWKDGGFVWLAYDALKATSAVPGAPGSGRIGALQSDACFHLPVRTEYSPKALAEFTVNHMKRNQLRMSLGISDTSVTAPSSTWSPGAIYLQGGAYAFDGSTTAVDGTFVYDFTDLIPVPATSTRRYYLGMYDSAAGDVATLKSFKFIDVEDGNTVVCSQTPKTADGAQQVYVYVDYAFSNTPPTISDIPNQVTNEDTPTGAIPFAVDDDKTPAANLAVAGTSSNTTLVPNTNIVFGGSGTNRTVTVTPAANRHGTTTITVTVTDGGGLTASDTFTLTVNPVNDPPVTGDQNVTTAEDTPKAITLTATDADGDALTYIVVSGPSHGTLSGTAPNLTYTPDADYSGPDSFTFKANDGMADSNVATVSITVAAVNDPPVIQSGPAAAPNPVRYGETVAFSVTASDADGDTLSYSWDFGDGTASTQEDPAHIYAAPGTYAVTITVSDGKGGTATGSVTVEVTADPLTLGGLKISREFTEKRRLKIQAKGQIQVPAGISPNGTTVELDIAGVVVSGAMDGKGKIALENLKFSLKPKWLKKADGSLESVAGAAKFKASILESDADWAEELDAAGLVAGVPVWTEHDIPFSLSVGANHYSDVCPGLWKATVEKGKFKGPVE
ncbi:MAG: Ig-like domain-containing protein [Planctomycetota bacterium]|nr:Ig-like domain-containing protein [Planctomycetota bacterium]